MTMFRKFLCRIGWHEYYEMRKLTEASIMVGCHCCPKRWGMNHDVRGFLPWDDVRELYERFAREGVIHPMYILPRNEWPKP